MKTLEPDHGERRHQQGGADPRQAGRVLPVVVVIVIVVVRGWLWRRLRLRLRLRGGLLGECDRLRGHAGPEGVELLHHAHQEHDVSVQVAGRLPRDRHALLLAAAAMCDTALRMDVEMTRQ